MKKMTFFACAALLTSAVVLSSCNQNEPGGDPNLNDGDVVKTEFAISLPDQAVGGPNRMPAATVQTEGIENFQGMTTLFLVPFVGQDSIEGAEVRLGKNIHLGDLIKTDIQSKKSKAKVYADVQIPLTTGSFLFYARSAATGDKNQIGSLIAVDTANNNPSAFHFDLEPILGDNASAMSTAADALMAYLSSIANVDDGKGTPVAWKDYPADSVALHDLFGQFTSMTGLSSFEISRVLTDLYKILNPVTNVSPLSKAIVAAINNGTYATIGGDDTVRLKSPYDNFPAEYGIPVGCVMIQWNGSNAFISGDYSNKAQPANFVYPAQLWYTANSTIKTANKSMKSAYDAFGNYWQDILDLYDADGKPAAVNSLTRSVAIEDTIQYAVARFDTQVKIHKDTTHLIDNSKTATGIRTDVPIIGDGFPVTAILIGGQKNVGYNFAPLTGTEYTVYDNVLAATMVAKKSNDDYSAKNYTLVLESGTADVNIAVEMVNNSGVDFYGQGGQLVPKNGKFYVVAKLTAAQATETGGHVFKQDYTTTAKLRLKNLQSAYNTIPDLRTPQLELGFAVDLSWKSGHTYEIDFD